VPYNVSKGLAELAVRAANCSDFETISIRPAWTWGVGDRHLLPEIVETVKADRFAWLGGGRHGVATSHVDNVVEALVLAAEAGVAGATYFVTDGAEMTLREFVSALLETQGVKIPTWSMPLRPVLVAARAAETLWRLLMPGKRPPLTLAGCLFVGLELTVDDTRARRELGYAPVRTVDEGLRELRETGSCSGAAEDASGAAESADRPLAAHALG
jgi:nucleoside-diphosphate-sugar epimerase